MNDTNNKIWIKFYSKHWYYIRKDSVIGVRCEGIPYSMGEQKYFLLLSNGKEIKIEEYHLRDSKIFEALEIKE